MATSKKAAAKKPATKKTTKAPRPKVPTPTDAKIKADYLAGMGPKDLAKKYGIGYETIRTKIKNGNWAKARTQIARKTTQNTLEKIAKKNADYVAREIQRDAEIFSGWAKVLKETYTKSDRNGVPVAVKKIKKTIVNKNGTPRDIDAFPSAFECKAALQAAKLAADMKFQVSSYFKFAREESGRETISQAFNNVTTMDDLAAAIRNVAQAYGDTGEFARFAADILYKQQLIEFAKDKALSKKEFAEMLQATYETVQKIFGKDSEGLEQFNRVYDAKIQELLMDGGN